MVLDGEGGERLADDEADIQRQAGIFHRLAAGAIQHGDMIGILEDDIARLLEGDDVFQVLKADLLVDGDQLARQIPAAALAVVAFGESGVGWRITMREGADTRLVSARMGARNLAGMIALPTAM